MKSLLAVPMAEAAVEKVLNKGSISETDFLKKYRGFLSGVLKWDELSRLWETISEQQQSWFIYAVGETPPDMPATPEQLDKFIHSIDELLRKEHEEDYCGIVYVDDVKAPSLVKIYDPNNLGVVCGYSENPPLPGWVMSQIAPLDLQQAFPPSGSRKRWWQKIFS
jgi:hypothetical protein